jgi:hypothetical protein
MAAVCACWRVSAYASTMSISARVSSSSGAARPDPCQEAQRTWSRQPSCRTPMRPESLMEAQTPIQITAGGVHLGRRECGDMERALPDGTRQATALVIPHPLASYVCPHERTIASIPIVPKPAYR